MLVSAFAGREAILARLRRGGAGALPLLQLRRRDADQVGNKETLVGIHHGGREGNRNLSVDMEDGISGELLH